MSNLPTWPKYVQFTHETANYPSAELRLCKVPAYVYHGLREEVGELHGVFKRRLRDDGGQWTGDRLAQLRGEIGDVLWYCARYAIHEGWADDADEDFLDTPELCIGDAGSREWWREFDEAVRNEDCDAAVTHLCELCAEFGWTLAEIAAENMAKLRDRKARGVIQGKGDTR